MHEGRAGIADAASRSRRSVVLLASASGYFAAFTAWRLSGWGSATLRPVIVDIALIVPGVVATVFALLASRRCGDARTASAWHWVTASFVFLVATFAVTLGYQATANTVPFPSAIDALYFAFYVLFFVGLLRFPKRPETGAERRRLLIDATIVALGAASVIWLLVLGHTVTDSGQDLVDGAVGGAYPVGDVLQIFLLAYVMTRVADASTRRVLRLLLASTLLAIIGDVATGWMALHPQHSLQLVVDLAFMAAWMMFVLAGPAQQAVTAESTPPGVPARGAVVGAWTGRAAWLPYLAPTVVVGLLVYVQFGGSFVNRVGLTTCAALVSALVLARQFLARRDLEHAQEKLSFLALHDALTGLPNRTLVLDRAERMLARARRAHTQVAVLYIDVDGFKQVNDTLGHASGDALLQATAARLSSVVREADTVGRMGGDEFVVLLESLDAGPELVAERILEVLGQPMSIDPRQRSISASIGIAISHDTPAEALLHEADLALYEAKNNGKNRYVVFETAMQTVAHERLLVSTDLANAVDGEQLFLLYQPTFDLRTERMNGVEALLRWRHPTRGLIMPGDFIPLAEETGQIVPIGRWVMHEACRQAAAWDALGYPIGIAVNVSARQFDDDDLLGVVQGALASSGLDPVMLTLEITETTLMRNADATAQRLTALKDLGVSISIDDFGTGYSSLAYLRQFPVDAIKIDRSFISGIAISKESSALIHTLVQLGKALGLQTFGEGIEEPAQLQTLQREDCDVGQGFLLARPLDVDAVEDLLRKAAIKTQQAAAGHLATAR